MKSAIALRRSHVQLPNTFDVNIFLQPSSDSDGPDPPLVFIAAFLTNSSFISSKIIGWVSGGSPLIKVPSQACFGWGCFCFKELSVFSSRGRIPIAYYLLTTSMPHWCYLFPSASQTFSKRWQYFFGSLFDVNLCWNVWASNNEDLISPLSHNCSLLSRASKWFLLFDVLLGFGNNNALISS